MLAVLMAKAGDDGRFTPESVWLAWKNWEFGQKKAPSRWVTFLAWRIATRSQRAALVGTEAGPTTAPGSQA